MFGTPKHLIVSSTIQGIPDFEVRLPHWKICPAAAITIEIVSATRDASRRLSLLKAIKLRQIGSIWARKR